MTTIGPGFPIAPDPAATPAGADGGAKTESGPAEGASFELALALALAQTAPPAPGAGLALGAGSGGPGAAAADAASAAAPAADATEPAGSDAGAAIRSSPRSAPTGEVTIIPIGSRLPATDQVGVGREGEGEPAADGAMPEPAHAARTAGPVILPFARRAVIVEGAEATGAEPEPEPDGDTRLDGRMAGAGPGIALGLRLTLDPSYGSSEGGTSATALADGALPPPSGQVPRHPFHGPIPPVVLRRALEPDAPAAQSRASAPPTGAGVEGAEPSVPAQGVARTPLAGQAAVTDAPADATLPAVDAATTARATAPVRLPPDAEWVLREAIRAAARSAPEIEPRPETSGDAASSPLASALQTAGGPRGSGEAAAGQAGPAEISRAAEPPAAPTPGPSRVTIPFADDRGEGQVRLVVHGQAVRATIVTDDAATAQRMEAALADLHRSLGEHGFTDAQVTIAAPRAADRVDHRVVTAGAPDAPMARAEASATPSDHRGGEPRRDDSAPGRHTAEEREAARRQSRERQKGRHP